MYVNVFCGLFFLLFIAVFQVPSEKDRRLAANQIQTDEAEADHFEGQNTQPNYNTSKAHPNPGFEMN